MNRRISVALLMTTSVAVGCFQELDKGVTSGGPVVQPGANTIGNGLPDGFGDADLTQPCPTGSALCYQICGAPSCANEDATIPTNLATPVIYLPDGSTTTDPCVQVRAEALIVRERSCAACHNAPADQGSFDYVLDDAKLVQSVSATYDYPADAGGGKRRMIIAGDPENSWVYQRIAGGQMPPAPANASHILGPTNPAFLSLVWPTADDVSVLHEWILNCGPGTDGGAYSSSYYGATYGPGPDGGGSSGGGSGGQDAGLSDARGGGG
jgi:hypothetical protein